VTLQATFAATLVEEWARSGVTHAVVAPGSRSSPLALALADRLRLHVLLDERSAGFYALGLGLATGAPAVVLTTSGTAAVELHPAVVEAHQSGVAMIVCTADRPSDLHNVSAPQTVVQSRLFGDSVRWWAEPGVAEGFPRGSWRSLASRAFAESVAGPGGPGPVHLNLAFRDPLVAEPDDLPPGRDDGRPWHQALRTGGGAPPGLAERLRGRRGVVVAGRGGAGAAIGSLAEALAWPVLADPLSGARCLPGAVAAFDGLLRCPDFAAAHEVETVLRMGHPPASKVLSSWLAGLGRAEQVVVDPHGRWPDPERRADLVVHADPERCAADLAAVVSPAPEGWLARWAGAEAAAQEAIDSALAAHPEATEPGVARVLTARLPDAATLFVSSSMPIRDIEWFGAPGSSVRVLANRGANGIDGIVSTALGLAAGAAAVDPATGAARPVVALLGDLAFLHDAGGLLAARRRGLDCTLVVLDNHGGGIFSFLPQAASLGPGRFEALFATPQEVDLAALAEVHGLAVTTVDKAEEVWPAVREAVAAGGVRLVHVRTDRQANVALHEELHTEMATALGRRP